MSPPGLTFLTQRLAAAQSEDDLTPLEGGEKRAGGAGGAGGGGAGGGGRLPSMMVRRGWGWLLYVNLQYLFVLEVVP